MSGVRHSPLALWHLLSLDAPTVAALWTWFIARSCGISLPFTAIAAMFLAVWILYAADRLLDAQHHLDLEARHHFHHRHRRVFHPLIILAAIVLAALTPELLPHALRLYALLGALLCGWFLLIHTRLANERRLPKELAVGLFFTAATFIPTVARRADLRLPLLAPALLFGVVCALNCMFLYAWEHPGPRRTANLTTHLVTQHLALAATVTLFAAALCLSFLHFRTVAYNWAIPAACAGSVVMLLILHRERDRLSPVHLRSAADLALLFPLLLVPFVR